MDAHRRAELRSLAYHREIAARLTARPELLAQARARVARWQAGGPTHPRWAAEWARLLALPLAELQARLVDGGEAMTAVRQCTPFAGALAPRERWALWRAAGVGP